MKKRVWRLTLLITILSVLIFSLISLNSNALIYCREEGRDCEYDPPPYDPPDPPGRTCSCRISSCGSIGGGAKCGVSQNNCGWSYKPKCTIEYAEQCYSCPPSEGGGTPTAALVYGGSECYPSGYGCLTSACSCVYEPTDLPECGNSRCDLGEDCNNCPADCGSCGGSVYCGDGKCNGAETCSTCPADCGSCSEGNPPPDTTEPGCECTSWVQVGGCHERCSGFLEVRYERSCTPAGCDATAKCREHPDCCICTEWQTVSGCGEQGCSSNRVKQTRHCPVDCDIEERCKKMDYCSDCTLTNAKWTLNDNEIDEVNEGTYVNLEVEGTPPCNDLIATFDILENDAFGDDDYTPDPDPAVFYNNKAATTWETEWIKDEFNLLTLDNDPEYYFIAKLEDKELSSKDLYKLLTVKQVLEECGDSECDTGETPVNCPQDCGCKVNEKACVINDEITCVPYEFECDSPLNCDDDFCLPGLICVTDNGNVKCSAIEESDGYCPSDPLIQPYDPDCCNMQNAYWSTYCTGGGKTVILSVVGDLTCDGKELDIKIYEDDEPGINLPAPNPTIFEGDLATTYWETVYVDDGMGQGNPEFYYTATINELNINSNLMEVTNCNTEQDADCDGVSDDIDLCWNTPECSSVNGDGCSPDQASCLIFWDCSSAEWDGCDDTVENKRYRDITLCVYNGDLNSPCNNIELLPKTKECSPEEAFPFFTAFNLIIAVMIISLYYFFFFIKKKPIKKKR